MVEVVETVAGFVENFEWVEDSRGTNPAPRHADSMLVGEKAFALAAAYAKAIQLFEYGRLPSGLMETPLAYISSTG